MKQSKQIRILLSNIEEKTGWNDISSWSDKKYSDLSEDIFQKTGVQISLATLKRISGKVETPDDYMPSETSLDALTRYLGYTDWYQFIHRGEKVFRFNPKKFFLTLLFLTACLLSLYFYFKADDENDYKISIKESVGKAPFTAIFHYSIPENKNVKLHVNELLKEAKSVSPERNTITHLFTYPTYIKTELKIDKKVIKTIPVHVLSEDWQVLYVNNNKENKIVLHHPISKNGCLTISKKEIDSIINLKSYEQSWIHYVYSDTFAFECENIIAHTRIRCHEKEERETGCHFGQFTLIGENERISARFCDTGCSKWIKLFISENYINGEYNDLSMFEQNMNNWLDIRIENIDKQVKIFCQNKLLYQKEYKNSIGKLKMIYYDFSVSGEVDFINISNPKGEVLYQDDFDD